MTVPPPLSLDLRSRILEAYLAGEGSFVRLAERFGVGEASVNRIGRPEDFVPTGSVPPTLVSTSRWSVSSAFEVRCACAPSRAR